ncbi:MAG: hypothetical protein ABL912_01680 [Novosphingobium sp.]
MSKWEICRHRRIESYRWESGNVELFVERSPESSAWFLEVDLFGRERVWTQSFEAATADEAKAKAAHLAADVLEEILAEVKELK